VTPGCNVCVTYRSDKDGAEETAKKVRDAGSKAIVLQIDVGDEDQVKQMINRTISEFGGLNILVNNAGKAL